MATARVDGLPELVKAFQALGKSAGKATLRRIGKKALAPIAETARRLAPVDDGNLRGSIVVSTSLSRSAKEKGTNVAQAGGGFRSAAKDSVSIYVARPTATAFRASSVRSARQPILFFDRLGLAEAAASSPALPSNSVPRLKRRPRAPPSVKRGLANGRPCRCSERRS